MFHTALTPPSVSQTAVDHYVAKGKRVRSRAIVEMVKGLFAASGPDRRLQADCPA